MRRKSTLVTTLCSALLLPMAAGAQSPDANLAGRVVKLEQALSNRGLLDLLNQVESLKQENQSLRGQLENQGYEIEQLKKGQAAVYLDMDRRLQTIEGGAPGVPGAAPLPMLAPAPGDAVAGTPAPQSALQVETEGGTPPLPAAQDPLAGDGNLLPPPMNDAAAALDAEAVAGAPGAGSPPAPIQPTLAPAPLPGRRPAGVTEPGQPGPALAQAPTLDDAASEAAYRDAFSLLRAGEYERAVAAFNDFQTNFPQSQYGDNAQYWLAEAHYAQRDYAAAVTEYQKMLVNYPASLKRSHAMLKIGYSYDSLGQPAEARAMLDELRQRFPGSAAARLAEERLSQLTAAP